MQSFGTIELAKAKQNGKSCMILKRIGQKKGIAFYQGDDGFKYELRVVDRAYPNRKNPPVYYLMRVENGKPKYLSGLFRTGKQGIYSLDLKDNSTGMQVVFDARFMDEGETIELVKKGSKQTRTMEVSSVQNLYRKLVV